MKFLVSKTYIRIISKFFLTPNKPTLSTKFKKTLTIDEKSIFGEIKFFIKFAKPLHVIVKTL